MQYLNQREKCQQETKNTDTIETAAIEKKDYDWNIHYPLIHHSTVNRDQLKSQIEIANES